MECAIAYSLGDLHVWGSACNQFKNENVTKERKVPLPICQMEKEKLPEKLPKLRNRPLLLLCLPAHPRLQRSLLPKNSNLSPSHLYLLSSPQFFTWAEHCLSSPCHVIPYHAIPSNTMSSLPPLKCSSSNSTNSTLYYVSPFNGTVQCDKCFHATNTISNDCETQTAIWTTLTFQRKTFTLCVQWIYVNCAAGGYTSGATLHWRRCHISGATLHRGRCYILSRSRELRTTCQAPLSCNPHTSKIFRVRKSWIWPKHKRKVGIKAKVVWWSNSTASQLDKVLRLTIEDSPNNIFTDLCFL